MKKTVIIGAGQTGRGYLARLLKLSGQPYTFLDKDKKLIEELRKTKKYQIYFGDSEREPLEMEVSDAYAMDEEGAAEALKEADLIFTAVAEQNLQDLIPDLRRALAERTKKNPPALITCENGVSPKEKLADSFRPEEFILSEAVIFCTTLKAETGLNILSEDLDWLPYDVKALGFVLPFRGMEAEERFPQLLERKIYTYNCLSACIAYPGAYLGYEDYAEAANDFRIMKLLNRAEASLDVCLSKRYGISREEQEAFTQRAIRKFQNRSISDTIERNVRDVQRKLGPRERIFAPMEIMRDSGCDTWALEITAAAALFYGEKTQGFKSDGKLIERPLESLGELFPWLAPEIVERIRKAYGNLENLKNMEI